MSETEKEEISEAVAPMPKPGQRLRQQREAKGLTVQEVASRLRLGARIITALEADDHREMPSATFVTGYLRAYARLLDIPESELDLPRQASQDPPLVSSVGTAEQSNSRDLPIRLISILIFIVLAVSLGLWWSQNADSLIVDTQQDESAPPVFGIPPQATPAVSMPEQTPSDEVSELPTVEEEAETTVIDEGMDSEPSPERSVVKPPLALTEVELRYTAESWTEIRDNRGEQLAYGLIEAGRVLRLQGEAPFSIFLGYAPGVSIYFNDELFDHSPFQRRDVARFRLGGPEHNRPSGR